MTREECNELREELKRDLLDDLRASEKVQRDHARNAAAGVEARLKIWIFAGLLTLIALVFGSAVWSAVSLGSYRERVDQNYRRIERIEQLLDDRRLGRQP